MTRQWEGHVHGELEIANPAKMAGRLLEGTRLEVDDDWGLTTEYAMRQQLALLRLHIWSTGAIASAFNTMGNELARMIPTAVPDAVVMQGQIPGIMVVVDKYLTNWRDDFTSLVNAVRMAATWIAWGTASRLFGAAMTVGLLEEQVGVGFPTWDPNMPRPDGTTGGWSPVFVNYGPVLDSATLRVNNLVTGLGGLRYSDGKNLSDRIWAIPGQARRRVLSELITAAGAGESAYDAARRFQTWLAPGQNCPRWTSTRLGLTKAQIAAGDRQGLYSGNPCKMKGVAYNALRLLRNEMQIVHHAATDQIFAAMPWVEFEKIVLSPDHPDIGCECESIVVGGQKSDGVYRKGAIMLPIHVQCLCFKVPIMLAPKDMAKRLRGWLEGTSAWPEMDQFAQWFNLGAVMNPFIPLPDNQDEVDELEAAGIAYTEDNTASIDMEHVLAVLADGTEAEIAELISQL